MHAGQVQAIRPSPQCWQKMPGKPRPLPKTHLSLQPHSQTQSKTNSFAHELQMNLLLTPLIPSFSGFQNARSVPTVRQSPLSFVMPLLSIASIGRGPTFDLSRDRRLAGGRRLEGGVRRLLHRSAFLKNTTRSDAVKPRAVCIEWLSVFSISASDANSLQFLPIAHLSASATSARATPCLLACGTT